MVKVGCWYLVWLCFCHFSCRIPTYHCSEQAHKKSQNNADDPLTTAPALKPKSIGWAAGRLHALPYEVGKRGNRAVCNTYTLVPCWHRGPGVERHLCDVLRLSRLLSLGFPSLPLRFPRGWIPSAQTHLFSSQPFPKNPGGGGRHLYCKTLLISAIEYSAQ